MSGIGVTRRALLGSAATGAVAVAAGCSGSTVCARQVMPAASAAVATAFTFPLAMRSCAS